MPEADRNFRSVRQWLDVHSDAVLGYDPKGKNDELAGVPEDLKELVTRLKEATAAMAASHQKDTTQDYQIVPNQLANRPATEKPAAELAEEAAAKQELALEESEAPTNKYSFEMEM